MEKKKWIKILFAFCMVLILSPVSTVFADGISESADIISASKAVSASDSRETIRAIELNLKPITEITNINDFQSITYSPSDKIHLKEVTVLEGYDNVMGPVASVYNSDKAYTVIYEFGCDK